VRGTNFVGSVRAHVSAGTGGDMAMRTNRVSEVNPRGSSSAPVSGVVNQKAEMVNSTVYMLGRRCSGSEAGV